MRVIRLLVPDTFDAVIVENLSLITAPDVPEIDDTTRAQFIATLVSCVVDRCLLQPSVARALLDLNGMRRSRTGALGAF